MGTQDGCGSSLLHGQEELLRLPCLLGESMAVGCMRVKQVEIMIVLVSDRKCNSETA